jgi:hypothetical protein
MSDDDVLLDRVLAGLRDAQPSPGFERRLLAGIDAHQVRRANWWWPVFALACAVFAAVFVHNFRHVPATVKVPVLAPITTVATKAPERESVPPPAPRILSRTLVRTSPHHQPAPPLPLTEQEKLLLHLAHRPDDATILNPVTREAQSARATTEFQHFFQMDEAEIRSQLE